MLDVQKGVQHGEVDGLPESARPAKEERLVSPVGHDAFDENRLVCQVCSVPADLDEVVQATGRDRVLSPYGCGNIIVFLNRLGLRYVSVQA